VLVLTGATVDGTKEPIAIHDGQRESEQSWLEVLGGLKGRGLTEAPRLASCRGRPQLLEITPEPLAKQRPKCGDEQNRQSHQANWKQTKADPGALGRRSGSEHDGMCCTPMSR
jgi:hypothetical protein